MKFKLVIFDIDGTLIDSEETGVLSLMQTIRELTGLEVPYNEAYRWFGISSADVSRDVHFDDAVAFGERWEENFVALTHLIKPFSGALEMVAAIHEAGFRTGIVTARNHFEFDKDVHIKPFLKYIDHIVCADDTARRKPDPEPMRHCVALASGDHSPILPSEAIYFGDTIHDFRCADGAGCCFALADWRSRGLQGIPAPFRFTSAAEALQILGI
jgi:HAD superfamily hydrolase (TIGR01549 family)